MNHAANIQLSPLDEERFGIRAAKVHAVTFDQLADIHEFCLSNRVRFLIARCDALELRTAQALEAEGFSLMDTLVTYGRSVNGKPTPAIAQHISIRSVCEDEAQSVSDLAARIFRGYGGHYHADPRLDPSDCDKVYSSWAYRSCTSRQVADVVFSAEMRGELAGFVTVRRLNESEGNVPLYGVNPELQGQGIGRALIVSALRWLGEQQVETMHIATQITNLSSQKVWIHLGFEPSGAEYTFHKWFD